MDIIFLLIGLAAGFGLGFLFFKLRGTGQTSGEASQVQLLTIDNNQLKLEAGRAEERVRHLQADLISITEKWEAERGRVIQLTQELSAARTGNENLLQRLNEQKQEVEQLQERFKTEFKNIANELLEDKSKRFTEQNQEKLGEILKPLHERIKSFEERVENTHKESLERNAGLVQQILNLKDLNQQMSTEARNLTRALKGDNK
eukprot:gene2111-2749_t